MSQPVWKLHKSLGDVGIILKDATGVYPEEAEIWQDYEDHGKTMFEVYRWSLDRMHMDGGRVVNGVGNKEWFSDKLESVASSAGTTKVSLQKALCSRDPVDRFWAYYDIGGHFGFDNFDSYPLRLTEKELEKRQQPTARKLHTQRYGYVTPGSRRSHKGRYSR